MGGLGLALHELGVEPGRLHCLLQRGFPAAPGPDTCRGAPAWNMTSHHAAGGGHGIYAASSYKWFVRASACPLRPSIQLRVTAAACSHFACGVSVAWLRRSSGRGPAAQPTFGPCRRLRPCASHPALGHIRSTSVRPRERDRLACGQNPQTPSHTPVIVHARLLARDAGASQLEQNWTARIPPICRICCSVSPRATGAHTPAASICRCGSRSTPEPPRGHPSLAVASSSSPPRA